MAATKKKTRTVIAKVVGAVPRIHGGGVGWMVRMTAPHFRFFIDSEVLYESQEKAEAEADKWRNRVVKITVTK